MLRRITNALKHIHWGQLVTLAYLVLLILLLTLTFTNLTVRPVAAALSCVLIALPLALLVHELGHLVAGVVLGFRVVSFSIGPFLWSSRDAAGGRARLRLHVAGTSLLGQCAVALPDIPNLRDHLLVYVAGGNFASGLFVAFALVETALFGDAIWAGMLTLSPVWWAAGVLVTAGWLSLLRLLLSLYPAPATDGHALRELLRGHAHARRHMAIVRLRQAIRDGVRPRAWDPTLADDLTALHDRSAESLAAYHLAYRWALDCGDAPAAEKYLARAVESRRHAPLRQRATLIVEAAYLEMYLRANRAHAQAWLRKTRGEMQLADQFPKWRLLCAVEVTLQQTSVARSVAKRALRALDGLTDGLAAAERDMFQDLLERCDQPPIHSADLPPNAVPLVTSAEIARPDATVLEAITPSAVIVPNGVPVTSTRLNGAVSVRAQYTADDDEPLKREYE